MATKDESYTSFLRSLANVKKERRNTQLVFSVSGTSFCWISLNSDRVQIFPPLGDDKHPTRVLRKEGPDVLCINCRSGTTDAKYYDPDGILRPTWSYPGFRTDSVGFDYAVSLIQQAYDQAGTHKGGGGRSRLVLSGETHKNTTTKSSERLPKFQILDITEGQIGISYNTLFGPYLHGAKSIKLVDPYLRYDYQIRNFMEFCKSLPEHGTIELELITRSNSQDHEVELSGKLNELKASLLQDGILFNYKIDKALHDREIVTNNGWRILLSRGLDIFQRPTGRFSLDAIDQSRRLCKATTITYTRIPHVSTGQAVKSGGDPSPAGPLKPKPSQNELLGQFEEGLRRQGLREGAIETHVRRVSVFLNYCGDHEQNPLEIGAMNEFIRDREGKNRTINTINAYKQSIKTFIKTMAS